MTSSIASPFVRIGDRLRRLFVPLVFGILLAAPSATHAQVQVPGFSASLSPETIGIGSCSELTLTISNDLQIQVTNLAFTLDLPAGVVLATPAAPFTDCDGTLTAPDGGTTVTLSGGRVAAQSSCIVRVGITSSLADDYVLTTGDLTSTAGNSGSASVDLAVEQFSVPGFTKIFSPNPLNFGGRSTLTYTINHQNETTLRDLTFTDILPPGITVADPSNASTDCPGSLVTAVPGTNTISLAPEFFGSPIGLSGGTCTITVDVIGGTVGLNNSISSPLTFSGATGATVSAGRACAVLAVLPSGTLQLTKSFLDDPVAPGGTATLEFTLSNLDRSDTVSNITFTDDLDATLSGLTAVGLPASDVCGAGSTLAGTSAITLSGGSLGAGESCTFSVEVQIPAAAPTGAFPNTTSDITGDASGRSVTGTAATDTLHVAPIPTLTKEFTDDPVSPGGTVTLEYTITNTSTTSTISDLAFTDDLTSTITTFPVTVVLPADGFCGAGSKFELVSTGADMQSLSLSGGSLDPSESCTFSVTIELAPGVPSGVIPSTSSPITGTVDAAPVIGAPASDDLVIIPPVNLAKEFTDDPVLPGDTVTLEFTISHDGEGAAEAGTATNIEFTDDLSGALAGLEAVGLPRSDICGPGSVLSGTSTLSLTGGTLDPDTSCTFSVTLQVPAAALPGNYPNTTSSIMADVAGVATTGLPAEADLTVAGLSLTKEFIDDPVLPGGTATLEFTLTNSSAVDATGISFTDSLDAAVDNMTAVLPPTPDPPCGPGSSLIAPGGTVLVFTGGTVPAGTSCSFQVTVQVPAATANGTYNNVTSALSATMGMESLTLDPATDILEVNNSLLMLTKEFTDDPVPAGGTTTLEFTLTNLSDTEDIHSISFTDDLGAALPGLVAVGLPASDVCGAGSQINGTSLLTFTGGSLGAGASCTFGITLQVPPGVASGTVSTNTTSDVSGMTGTPGATSGNTPVTGNPASANLVVQSLTLTKSFGGPASPGGTATLSFTIANMSDTATATDLSFSDDLDAVIPGMVAVGLPQADVCGTGSQLAGTSLLTLTGASLLPGGSCTFDVTVQIPTGIAAGFYTNTTTDLRQDGSPVAGPATADLEIVPSAAFSKSFAPDPIAVGETSTLTFTIDNSGNAIDATNLDFTDTLPAGLVIADPANASTTCTGGTLTAAAGTGVITYTGGSVAAGATCTVQVDVVATAAGTFANTSGDLTSSLGNGGSATATLTVNPAPGFAKAFAPNSIDAGQVSTLTFTVDNSGSTADATGIDFTDNLPAGLVIATPPNASTDCTGGVLTAAAGAGTISYTGGSVPAGASCTVSVDVTSVEGGAYVNTSGDLTSSLGNSGPTSETLDVLAIVSIRLTKTESIDPVVAGSGPGNLIYVITATNNGPSTATGLVISEALTLPPGVTVDSVTPSAGSHSNPAWDLGTLAASDSETLTVVLTVDSSAMPGTDVISDTADVFAVNEENRVDGETNVTESTSIASEVDIALTKVESIDPVIAGSGIGNLIYTVTATNSGPSDAFDVVISEDLTLPGGVTVDSVVASAGSFSVTTAPDGTWSLDLPAGASESLVLTLTVAADAPNDGLVSNTVSLSDLNGTDTNAGNDSATEETTILAGVDLVVTKSESIDPVIAGSGSGNLTYIVMVTNNGPLEATGVDVTELLAFPGGVGLESLTPDAGMVDGNVWTIDTLAVGATATLEVVLTVGPATAVGTDTISNTAEVTAVDQPQINPGDESATVATSVEREVDLAVVLTESRDPVLAGFDLPGNLTHFVSVTNNGPSDSSGVELDVSQVLPAGVTFDSAILTTGSFVDPTWTVGELDRGDTVTIGLRISVPATVPGGIDTIRSTGMVSAVDETEIDSANDSATEATSVISPASMNVAAGDIALDLQTALFKQTITITNNNPLAVSAFRVLVNGLPADVSVHNAQGDSGSGPYLLYNQSLAAGASVDLVVEYFQEDVSGGFDPTFTIELLDPEEVTTAAPGVALERIVALPNGDILIEFASTPGGIYTVQYTEDGENWFNVVPDIIAGATRRQWIDNGPPKTPSHPSTSPTRLYRVVENADD